MVAVTRRKRPDLTVTVPEQIWQPAAAGCAECQNTGYRGRIGIFEAILIDAAVAALLVSNPNEREIWRAAAPQGILDLREDGVLKVLAGVTALAELARVVDLTEEVL